MLLKTKYDLDNAREQYGKLVDKQARKAVSYTHLTLPTNSLV